MSDTPRFLVVKYIPDLLRREPRNVGVILFAEDALVARFAGESEEPTPGVDKRRLAPFAIADPHNYARMIDYVREQLLAREGVGADDVLAECERGLGSYAVEEGGEVWVGRPDQEPPELLLELFTRLVGEPLGPEGR